LLKVENLNAGYGRIQAIRDINIHIRPQEIISIIGPNGAGKSTLLNTICGIVSPWSGRIFFQEKEITDIPAEKIKRFGISVVQEGSQIFESLTVFDNLLLGAYSRQRRGEKRENVEKEIELVCQIFPILRDRRKQLAGTLSGGERRMLSIGICLMSRPQLILLDEPSLGLAPLIIKEIYRVLLDLFKGGITILLVEQNVRIALDISTRSYVMETGRIALEGKSSELLDNEMVKRAYLGG
jgi:branched-chain amino acid transport system ATP-binding protein